MAQQDILTLKETFSDNKEPNGNDFSNLIDSFDHKSIPLSQSRILGLQQSFDSKASKEDLASVTAGLRPMGSVDTLAELDAIVAPNDNDSYYVKETLNEEGDPYIWRFDKNLGENGQWVNTKQVVYQDVAKAGGTKKTLNEVDKEANKYFTKFTSFPIVGFYQTSDNTLNSSSSWRTIEVFGKENDTIRYNVYSTNLANIITFFDENNGFVSSIPATGGLTLRTGFVSFPENAVKACISTHYSEIANSYYETSKTLERIDADAKLTTIKDAYFPIVGFYQSDNNFNFSANWRTANIEGKEGDAINYYLYSTNGANIATFLNKEGEVIANVPATGTLALKQGTLIFPVNAVKLSLSAHNSHISESYYERTSKISELFVETNNKIAEIVNGTNKTYIVKGNIATNANSFQTIEEALAVAVSGDLILVFSGTYSEYSLKIPDGVTVRGIGYVYINGYLPVTSTTADVEKISTIDLNQGGKLENLIVTAQNMRYPIHADFSNGNTVKDILNCHFIHHGNQEIYDYRIANEALLPAGEKAANLFRAMSAWGGGTKAGDRVYIRNCYFESPLRGFSTHNNNDFDTTYGASLVELTNCEFVSYGIDRDGSNIGFLPAVVIQSLASNCSDGVVFNNCRTNGYVCFHNALTHNVIFNMKGVKTVYNTLGSQLGMNDQINAVDVTKYPIMIDEIMGFKNLGAQTIARGKAVKRSSYGIELMTSADDASLFFGVAMQEFEVNKSGDVKKEGYLLRPYLDGLKNVVLADGDSISITADGSFEKSTNKIVCYASDNQNVLIRN